MRHPLIALTLVGTGFLALSACGSDDSAAGVNNQEEWCATVGEVDDLLASTDPAEDFAGAQTVSGEVNGKVQQLIAAIDVVDESVRDDVATTLQFVADLTAAVADATSESDAEAALTPIYESMPQGGMPGDAWILETCGVDIND